MKLDDDLAVNAWLTQRLAEDFLGHSLGEFMQCGDQTSAECVRPGCNMGLTIGRPDEGGEFPIQGSAVHYSCASDESALPCQPLGGNHAS